MSNTRTTQSLKPRFSRNRMLLCAWYIWSSVFIVFLVYRLQGYALSMGRCLPLPIPCSFLQFYFVDHFLFALVLFGCGLLIGVITLATKATQSTWNHYLSTAWRTWLGVAILFLVYRVLGYALSMGRCVPLAIFEEPTPVPCPLWQFYFGLDHFLFALVLFGCGLLIGVITLATKVIMALKAKWH